MLVSISCSIHLCQKSKSELRSEVVGMSTQCVYLDMIIFPVCIVAVLVKLVDGRSQTSELRHRIKD